MTQEARTGLIGAGVLALLGVLLFGLVLPAVSKTRDAARRSMCAGHLKQLVVALHNYADVYPGPDGPAFPPGTLPLPNVPPERRLSWVVGVLPFIEQDNVYQRFDRTAPADHPTNTLAARANIWHLLCPASGEYETLRSQPLNVVLPAASSGHYIGVAGVGSDAATLPDDDPRAGAFGYDRRRSLKDGFPDGTGSTLLLMEVGANPRPWPFGGPGTVRGVDPDASPQFGPARPTGGFHPEQTTWFRSRRHVCMAVMADGSTRTLAADIDPAVLRALATAGGKDGPIEP